MALAARGHERCGLEVIARAGLYIARLADTEISGSVAGWLLRSVERDLIDDARRARRTGDDLAVDDPPGDTAPLIRHHQAPSAEDAAFAGPLVWGALCDATRRGALSSASARVVLLHAVGHSLPDLARRAGTSRASVTASATGATPNSGTASPSPADPPSRRQACGETNPRSAALATDHPAPS